MKWIGAALLLGLIGGGALAQRVQHDPPPFAVAGEEFTIFRWRDSECDRLLLPDSPARMFRRDDGALVLFATHYRNWSLTGADFRSMKPECRPVLESSRNPDPAAHDFKAWIQATYTMDGRNVIALLSQEFTAEAEGASCETRERSRNCWHNVITVARSTDGGRSFELPPPERRVFASVPEGFDPKADETMGFMTTSNIVAFDGYYYVFIHATGSKAQRRGNCLLRASDPLDAAGWRAYDGGSFNVDLGAGARGETPQTCDPIAPRVFDQPIRSIVRVGDNGAWVAVFFARKRVGAGSARPGVFLSRSDDLLHWSAPQILLEAEQRFDADRCPPYIRYPSIIDPSSRSRNFETVRDSPFLLFTRFNLKSGPQGKCASGGLDRDLKAIPLRLQ